MAVDVVLVIVITDGFEKGRDDENGCQKEQNEE